MNTLSPAIVASLPADAHRPMVVYRVAGDSYLLVEYGEIVLDLHLRFRIHSLERAVRESCVPGILETAPGVRSLLIRYDCLRIAMHELVEVLCGLEDQLPSASEMVVPSRLVHLPIACHDRWTIAAVKQYMESVRADAPYTPDNMEFIARCNGLAGVDEVQEYVLATEHLVIGLGDVYLGAPCPSQTQHTSLCVRMWSRSATIAGCDQMSGFSNSRSRDSIVQRSPSSAVNPLCER